MKSGAGALYHPCREIEVQISQAGLSIGRRKPGDFKKRRNLRLSFASALYVAKSVLQRCDLTLKVTGRHVDLLRRPEPTWPRVDFPKKARRFI
jgi:hypothetical protein